MQALAQKLRNGGHGARKGQSKGNLKPGGTWLYVPAHGAPMISLKGKGFGKAQSKGATKGSQYMDKLAKIDASRKVWVGGLSAKTDWKALEKHIVDLFGTKPGITEVMPKGRACLAFKTDDDATSAISLLNATELHGKTIEADVWTEREKKDAPAEGKKQRQPAKLNVIKTAFAKKQKFVRGDPKTKEKLETVDSELKVWVGAMSKDSTHGQLRKHFADAGHKPHLVNLTGKDRACVSFTSADEATQAIATLNGSDFDGSTLEVDVWTKPEKKEKPEK